VLLISCGVAAAERERPVIAAIALGAAGLTRETALAAVSALFAPTAREGRGRWLIAAAAAGLPIALWTLYLAAEHPGWRVLAGAGDLGLPFAGIAASVRDLVRSGVTTQAIAGALALAAFALQAAVAVTSLATGADRSAWAWVAVTFAGAGVLAQSAVWTGPHDPFARITIPLAVGSNVLLARRIAPGWGLITLTNLGVLPGLAMFAGHWGGAG